MIVWLWDAAGPARDTSGVTADEATARERALALLNSGQATSALLQQAVLKSGLDILDAHYDRFGSRWQARRTGSGAFQWRPLHVRPPG